MGDHIKEYLEVSAEDQDLFMFTGQVTMVQPKFGFIDNRYIFPISCVEGDMPKLGDVAVVKGYVKDDMFFQCNATMVKVLSSPQNKFVNSGSNRRKISQQSPSVQPQLNLTRRNELGRPERRRYSSSSLSSEISSEFQLSPCWVSDSCSDISSMSCSISPIRLNMDFLNARSFDCSSELHHDRHERLEHSLAHSPSVLDSSATQTSHCDESCTSSESTDDEN